MLPFYLHPHVRAMVTVSKLEKSVGGSIPAPPLYLTFTI